MYGTRPSPHAVRALQRRPLLRITDSEVTEGKLWRVSPDLLRSWRVSTMFQFHCFSFCWFFSKAATDLARSAVASSWATEGNAAARRNARSPRRDVVIGIFRLLRYRCPRERFGGLPVSYT